MIEKPDVPDEVILEALKRGYAIGDASLEFVPYGLDPAAWAYRVETSAGPYFLKVNRGVVEGPGAWMPAFLAGRGLPNVIAPVAAQDGGYVASKDGLSLRLQPFIEGRRGIDGGLPTEAWTELGVFLRQLHTLSVPKDVAGQLKSERFESRRLKRVAQLNEQAAQGTHPDGIVAELIEFWRGERDTVDAVLRRTEDLSRRARTVEPSMVLCHADVHTANILLGADGRMYVIDWDDALLAPKERDLMFVLADSEPAEMESFVRGYGDVTIDSVVLAYYQYAWCVEDMGAFAEEILNVGGAGLATRTNALAWFKSLFADGGSVGKALVAEYDADR